MFNYLRKLDGFFYLTAILFSLTLTGCAPQVIVKTEYKAVLPEDHLIVDCEVALPPSKQVYLNAGKTTQPPYSISQPEIDPAVRLLAQELQKHSQREKLLFDFSMQQTQNLQKCNKRLKGLRDWKVKSRNAVENTPPPSLSKRE